MSTLLKWPMDLWVVRAKVMMSLVLVYAGTPTIFANFRTFIQLYFTIFHSYITLLRRSSTSQLYIAVLPRSSTSHSYVASHPMSHRNLRRITSRLAPSHCHCLVSLHVTCQVLGPSRAARTATP